VKKLGKINVFDEESVADNIMENIYGEKYCSFLTTHTVIENCIE
jgi:hypothetical protein